MSGSDFLRYLFMGAVGLVILVVGMKLWGKQKTEKRIVRELRVLANPTSSFEQIYPRDAEEALFKTLGQLHLAESKLEMDPGQTLEQVFRGKGDGALFPQLDPGNDRYSDPRETLIREGLLRNYQHARTLGLFESPENLRLLREGDVPEIMAGPDEGKTVVIRYIIDPEVAPGVEKLIPNMIIAPPLRKQEEGAPPTDFEIKQAKSLAGLLARSGLIENEAEDRIVAHYNQVNAPEPEPEPERALDVESESPPGSGESREPEPVGAPDSPFE